MSHSHDIRRPSRGKNLEWEPASGVAYFVFNELNPAKHLDVDGVDVTQLDWKSTPFPEWSVTGKQIHYAQPLGENPQHPSDFAYMRVTRGEEVKYFGHARALRLPLQRVVKREKPWTSQNQGW